jgi:N utilization substance protein A
MNAEMIAALRELEREKGIAFETILGGLQEAMASAYKAHWKQEHPEADDEFVGFRAVIDPETGDLRMWQQELEEVDVPPAEGSDEPGVEMKVISEAEVEVTDDFKGRIGAQTAKQVIFQKLRDAEREMTYEEFAGREGDVVTGIVQQQERRYTLLDLGKVEALLPQGEQVPSEPLRHGERLKAYITEVRRGTKGPGARDQRGDRRDHGRGSRAGPSLEDRGGLQRARGRSRRRVRRTEGLACANGRERAPRREDRRGSVVR